MKIKIKYFTDKVQKLEKISKGNWIDLRASEDVEMKRGEFKLIPLGIAVELPRGYEAHVVPRSSTFKNFGLIQVNHQGVIDGPDRETGEGGYCGNEDQWFVPMYALRDTTIHLNDRICQFRIMEQQPDLEFEERDAESGLRGNEMAEKKIYEVMHMDRRVARISDTGPCKKYFRSFL